MNLEDVMTAHADRAGEPVLTLRDVQQRAQRIQRRRRTAAAVVVGAAVAAIVLPATLLAGGHPDSAPRPGPASSGPSINADAVQQDPLDMRIARAEAGGAPPTVAWIEGRTLHRLDGSTVRLGHDYDELDVVGGNTYLAVRRGNEAETDGSSLDEIGADGSVVSTRLVTPTGQASVVTSADRTVAAWTTPDGKVQVWDRDGERTLASTGQTSWTGNAVAVFGSQTCGDPGDGCRVVVNPPDGDPVAYTNDGSEPVGGNFLNILTMSPDGELVAGNRGDNDGVTACTTVWDMQDDKDLHRCQTTPFGFSPDGRHTTEYAPQRDGEPAWIDIRDARTGELAAKIVARGDSDTSNIEPVAWEDARHYLVVALHQGRWLLLRGDLDGRLEIVEGPTDGPNAQQPYESPYVIAR
ncbi:hypothetical protein GUY44_19935 [Pimelobacter simplex]|uniref:Uncharacterized protein n=1 Tax=Nocardioides simplex TaxID=2045 RepID=A0A0A1DKJ0_NOCSI|nr:hypothetical protein [Pimelobacter simplex]AIY17864.1 hypothetical protein KR76_15775 [Pimelobacter simplex]MCG8152764.1 hypothetical protein [Pimelobacter simplex]GEB16864.1 hypothetical protein NSI01_51790 [Pimelobacter simplex]SFM73771.1 hypothetical protein SAMN05421671_3238 [Pimelobacter simplex]